MARVESRNYTGMRVRSLSIAWAKVIDLLKPKSSLRNACIQGLPDDAEVVELVSYSLLGATLLVHSESFDKVEMDTVIPSIELNAIFAFTSSS